MGFRFGDVEGMRRDVDVDEGSDPTATRSRQPRRLAPIRSTSPAIVACWPCTPELGILGASSRLDVRTIPILGLLLLLGASSCGVAKGVAETPGRLVGVFSPDAKPEQRAAELELVRSDVMRYADRIVTQIDAAAVVFAVRAGTPEAHERSLQWRLDTAETAYQTATQPLPFSALADLVAMCVYEKRLHQAHWKQKFGDADAVMVDVWNSLVDQGLDTVKRRLPEDLSQTLQKVVDSWETDTHDVEQLLQSGPPRFEDLVAKETSGEDSTSLFGVLGLNPMDSLEPATQEIARSRELAERAVYVAQRTPKLLTWRAELLVLRVSQQPNVEGVLEDVNRVTKSVEEATTSLPEKLRVEGDLLIQRVSTELAAQRSGLLEDLETTSATTQALLVSSEKTLDAATRLANALESMSNAADPVIARFTTPNAGDEPPPSPTEPPGKPFDPDDYTRLAAQLTDMVRELNVTADRIDKTMPIAQQNLDAAVARADQSVDRALDAVLRVALIVIGAIVVAALILRFVPKPQRAKS